MYIIIQYNPVHISQYITAVMISCACFGHESGIRGGIFSESHLVVEVAPLSLLASISSRLKAPILQWARIEARVHVATFTRTRH